jgi:taurine transport system permease protein
MAATAVRWRGSLAEGFASRTAKRGLRIDVWSLRVGSVGAVVVVWNLVATSGLLPDFALPTPHEVLLTFRQLLDDGYNGYPIWRHAELSLIRVFAGAATGIVVGTVLGFGMGLNTTVNALAAPFVEFFRPLPQLAYLVLLIAWLGIGDLAQIVLLFVTALPVAAVAARDGVRRTSLLRVQAARSLGASDWQVVRYVIWPSTIPDLFTGARLAIGIVYMTLVAAEMISGSSGLGWMMMAAGRELQTGIVIIGVVILGLVGLLLNGLAEFAEGHVVHWSGHE